MMGWLLWFVKFVTAYQLHMWIEPITFNPVIIHKVLKVCHFYTNFLILITDTSVLNNLAEIWTEL